MYAGATPVPMRSLRFRISRGTGIDAWTVQTRLLEEAGRATIAGTSFGVNGDGFLRFSYANSLENIEAAIARIRTLLG